MNCHVRTSCCSDDGICHKKVDRGMHRSVEVGKV